MLFLVVRGPKGRFYVAAIAHKVKNKKLNTELGSYLQAAEAAADTGVFQSELAYIITGDVTMPEILHRSTTQMYPDPGPID